MFPSGSPIAVLDHVKTLKFDRRMSDYISNFCVRVVADKRLLSSSKNLLLVPRSSTKFGDCSFSIAGTTERNSLLDYVKNPSSLETFNCQLKTYLFKQSYIGFRPRWGAYDAPSDP